MTISTLVVDDNANTRNVGNSLSGADINLVFANDGLDGLKQAGEYLISRSLIINALMDGLTLQKLTSAWPIPPHADFVCYHARRDRGRATSA